VSQGIGSNLDRTGQFAPKHFLLAEHRNGLPDNLGGRLERYGFLEGGSERETAVIAGVEHGIVQFSGNANFHRWDILYVGMPGPRWHEAAVPWDDPQAVEASFDDDVPVAENVWIEDPDLVARAIVEQSNDLAVERHAAESRIWRRRRRHLERFAARVIDEVELSDN